MLKTNTINELNIKKIIETWGKEEQILLEIATPYFELLRSVKYLYIPYKCFIDKTLGYEKKNIQNFKGSVKSNIHSNNLIINVFEHDDIKEVKSITKFNGIPKSKHNIFQEVQIDITIPKNFGYEKIPIYFLVSENFFYINDLWKKFMTIFYKRTDLIDFPNVNDSKYYKTFNELWKMVSHEDAISNFIEKRYSGNGIKYRPSERCVENIIISRYWKELMIASYYLQNQENAIVDVYFLITLIHKTLYTICSSFYFSEPYFSEIEITRFHPSKMINYESQSNQ